MSLSVEVPVAVEDQAVISKRTWPVYLKTWQVSLYNAWMCFDKVAGKIIGLDDPKYGWAIREYYRQNQLEEENGFFQNACHEKSCNGKATDLDAMESQVPGQLETMQR